MSIKGMIYGVVRHARSITGIGRQNNYKNLEVAIVLLLPDDVQNELQRWQLDILRRHGLNPGLSAPPHITLKLGFKFDNIEAIANDMAVLTKQTAQLPVLLKDFRHFDEGIIFLDVAPDEALERCRQSVVQMVSRQHGVQPRPIEQAGFHSHVTLTYGLPKQRFEQERALFAAMPVQFACVLDRMALLVRVDDHWVTYRSCPLAGVAQS
jgi:2'-5' RNA ligase